ncbi:MAG: I78 family peptidase inhibitor [Pseudomonadota bacterium]
MRFNKFLAPAVLACLASACAQQPIPSPASAAQSSQCNAAAAQFAMGGTANPALVEEARVRSGALTARTIGPGQVVTMEYSGQRLNLDVNAANVVMNVRCG